MWVYIQSEPGLWTVGFYSPDGKWNSEGDYDKITAAARVHYLNGGSAGRLMTLNINPTLQQFVDDHGGEEWAANVLAERAKGELLLLITKVQRQIDCTEKGLLRDRLIAEMNALWEKRNGI